jgi:hypothetical protein
MPLPNVMFVAFLCFVVVTNTEILSFPGKVYAPTACYFIGDLLSTEP